MNRRNQYDLPGYLLWSAVRDQDVNRTYYLLKEGMYGKKNQNLLDMAIVHNNHELVKVLLSFGFGDVPPPPPFQSKNQLQPKRTEMDELIEKASRLSICFVPENYVEPKRFDCVFASKKALCFWFVRELLLQLDLFLPLELVHIICGFAEHQCFLKFDSVYRGHGLVVSEDGLMVTAPNVGHDGRSILCNVDLHSGIHFWEMQMDVYRHGGYTVLGIAQLGEDLSYSFNYSTKLAAVSVTCSQIVVHPKQKGPMGKVQKKIPRVISQGDVVGMLVNFHTSRMYFFSNQMLVGEVEFDNTKSYTPAVGIHGSGDCVSIIPNVCYPPYVHPYITG